jgi:GT2 family glycosyltransferase
MAKLALVTVLYNSEDVIEGFFKSLSIQLFTDYHLYLIDNNPNTNSNNLVLELASKYGVINFTHIKNSGNFGVAKGNNIGIDLSLKNNAAYILLLNNDIEFHQPNLLGDMVACAERGESFIVPKILYYDTRIIWMAGGKLLKSKGYTLHVGDNQEDSALFNTDKYFDYAPTCFMLIKADVFNEVGLMDERYFIYFDDTDFIYRATQKGYKIFLMSALEVFHKVSFSTGGYETLFSIYYVNRNRIYFITKNLKGFYKTIALLYSFVSVFTKLPFYNKQQRRRLISGVKDALKMS